MEQTTSHLLVQVCRAHRNKAGELLAAHDLHPGQEFLLYNLWSSDGLTQSELAERLCVQPATLTRMVDRMEKGGWVLRRPDNDDQRVSRIYLTEAGRALEGPICGVWSRLEVATAANMTVEERLLLNRLLMQVLDNLS
jgi:DNA-binding MarR family transcriptional regulator